MLGHQGQTQSHPEVRSPAAALVAAVEPVEDPGPFRLGNTCAAVLDRDPHGQLVGVDPFGDLVGTGVVAVDEHPGRPVRVLLGVVEVVGEDSRHPPLVAREDEAVEAGVGAHLDRPVGEVGHGGAHPRDDGDPVELEADRSGVEARDLEQVLDELGEAGHVLAQQLEGLLGALGHLVLVVRQHLDGGVDRGQRRAELVADVAGESGVAVDALLQARHHRVEVRHQGGQVGVVDVLVVVEPGVELAEGDGLGRLADAGQRPQRVPAGPVADRTRGHRRQRGGQHEREAEGPQPGVDVVEAVHLEVGAAGLAERNADGDDGLAVDDHAHDAAVARCDLVAQGAGDGVDPEAGVQAGHDRPTVAGQDDRRLAGVRERGQHRLDVLGRGTSDRPLDGAGVGEHTPRHRLLALVDQGPSGDGQRRDRHGDRRQQGDERD